MSYSLAQRYTQALYELCHTKSALDAVYSDVIAIDQHIHSSTELKDFLENTLLPKERQEQILRKLYENKVNHLTMSFLLFFFFLA